jgi:hypothetical protein
MLTACIINKMQNSALDVCGLCRMCLTRRLTQASGSEGGDAAELTYSLL